MQPVNQTRRGEKGNCFAACMSSIFEIPIDKLPDPDPDDRPKFWGAWRLWLAERNLMAVILYTKDGYHRAPGYYIGGFRFPNREDGHALVMQNGNVIHDPVNGWPDVTPLTEDNIRDSGAELEYMVVFTVLDPTEPIGPKC